MDTLSKEKRSWNMSRIKSKDTAPELYVRSLLHRNGYRFRLHVKDLPGKPDIVLPKYKTVIFVHGCFWHQHINCGEGKIPQTKSEWWKNKLYLNTVRDMNNVVTLQSLGWKVLIIWECFIRKNLTRQESQKQKEDVIFSFLHSCENYKELSPQLTEIYG